MKKFIIFVIIALVGITSCQADSSFEYVKYGGELELIIKTETHWIRADTRAYGLRKNGMEIVEPRYAKEAVQIIDELSLLVFMCEDAKEVYVYDIKSGREVLHHKGGFYCNAYELTTEVNDGQPQWQIVETTIPDPWQPSIKTVVARFALVNGKVCRLTNPKKIYDKEEI